MTSATIASMPSGAAHREHRLGRHARVLEDDRDESLALERGAPARPTELAVLEVAERVRREQPVGLEEPAEERRGPWSSGA